MRRTIVLASAALASAVFALPKKAMPVGDVAVSAEYMTIDRRSGAVVATGEVEAVAAPFRMTSTKVVRDGDVYEFGDPTLVTTCQDTNCPCWSASGSLVYRKGSEFTARNMTLRLWNIPVAWIPFWWQPLDTDYGWRVMPGYRSRWGGYLLTKYVYHLAGTMDEGHWGLAGSTRFDLRTKNGVALGQGVRWNLGDFGKGRFKAYYAWDEDADRYDRRWNSERHRHYGNWGSVVPDERYGLMAEHRWHPTERDVVRARAAYYSDTHFKSDFLRDTRLAGSNRFPGADRNELAWEHLETSFLATVSVSGPLNDFYGGVARLPEACLAVTPTPVWTLPANYESQTRAGWLDRDYAKHGKASTTAVPFRYDPGEWADYQAFRADTYHRLTFPFRIADVVSAVPRIGVRGTYWSDTGRENLSGYGRAGSQGDWAFRSVIEGGVTFAARGTADFGGGWRHVLEPYADVLAQEAKVSGLRRGARTLFFDSVDGSADWLDQFAGRSRNLPYSWHGVTPGVRNVLRVDDGKLGTGTVLDVDFYAAVQFNDADWTDGNRYHRLSRSQAHPNYGRGGKPLVCPGFRARWNTTVDTALAVRAEWDGENDLLAYADASLDHRFSKDLFATLSYSARDQRWWDFSSTPYDPEAERNEDFNWSRFSYAGVKLEHEICDAVAWGPFVRWDLRENELDEVGAWIDLRTDCLGIRISFAYENDYLRIDGSRHDDDWRVGVGIYLRAFGRRTGEIFGY